MVVDVELVECPDQLFRDLKELSGVSNAGRDALENRVRITLETDGDIRADIAQLIVNSGGRLLSLNKHDDGLESIFLKMVKN